MSSFVGAAGGLTVLARDDFSGAEWATNGDRYLPKLWDRIPADDYLLDVHWYSEWWPSRASLMGGLDGVPENALITAAPRWAAPSTRRGANGRLAFVGYTRDQYGSPLGGCTVRCFRTSSDELVSKVTSDPATGYYIATTPYSDGHYLTVHKTLSPDVAGASIDTLVPG